jgi:WD40 repeat protein
VSDVLYDPANSYFFMSVSYDGQLKAWNAKDFSQVASYSATGSKLTGLAMTQDRKYIGTTSMDRKWMLWKKKTGRLLVVDEEEDAKERVKPLDAN